MIIDPQITPRLYSLSSPHRAQHNLNYSYFHISLLTPNGISFAREQGVLERLLVLENVLVQVIPGIHLVAPSNVLLDQDILHRRLLVYTN